MNELTQLRRANLRWSLLLALHNARPYSTSKVLLGEVARAIYPDNTPLEVRQELDYLADSELLTVTRQLSGHWFADLSAAGSIWWSTPPRMCQVLPVPPNTGERNHASTQQGRASAGSGMALA